MNHRDIEALIKGIAPVVRDTIAAAVKDFGDRIKAIESRTPEKGDKGDAGKDGEQGQPGKDGEKGTDAKAVTNEDMLAAIRSDSSIVVEAVASYLKENPPASGKDGDHGKPGNDGKNGRDGVDGNSVVSALIDRSGHLVLGLSDGKTVDLGLVIGRDGKNGDPGRDGFGFDDLDVAHDGERQLTVSFVKGDQKKEFSFILPAVIDRGVWREGEFRAGDGVSWDGSWFVAQKDTDKKPGTPESGWRLAAKRGRDGGTAFDIAKRAGFKGSETDWLSSLKGDRGQEGRPGRDLTQLGFDGSKR